MEITKVFRGLVVSSLVLFVVSACVGLLEPEYPEAVNAYLEGDGASPLFRDLDSRPTSYLIVLVVSALAFLIAFLASNIGLLMFKRWARTTFIVVTLAAFAFIPVQGVSFTTPLMSALNWLYAMIDGAILAMLLFDPIKAKFAKPSAPA